MMNRIVIYGTGENAKHVMEQIISQGDVIVGFCESKSEKLQFEGYPVYNVDEICHLDFDEIYIANRHIETLKNVLTMNVPKEKIVLNFEDIYGDNHFLFQYLKENKFHLDMRCNAPLMMTRGMSFVQSLPHTKEMDFRGSKLSFNDDYVRYGTLDLLVKEIVSYEIPGDIAELGVYQGKFASLLNGYFPSRRLHLFDTFEGFDERDTSYEVNFSCAKAGSYGDTSVDKVMDLMPNPDMVSIHKGFFPETIPEENLTYALVSLDCDLYKPVYEGLEYFCFHLSKGGYIMLHDYNGGYGKGVHAAIREVEKKHDIRLIKVPIPDEAGTVVITV